MRQPLIVRAAGAFASRRAGGRRALTLVEMLVAMAITLLMMAAIVTVFANITSSVTRRRATIEMSGQLRSVRETLARDLKHATCPTIPWRRPESNEGYFELIEGPQSDFYPSVWLWHDPSNTSDLPVEGAPGQYRTATLNAGQAEGVGNTPGIDLSVSALPGSQLRDTRLEVAENEDRFGRAIGSNALLPEGVPTDGRGLGDADDILMLTARNEQEPFVGRIPRIEANRATGQSDPATREFRAWGERNGTYPLGDEEYTSPLAEVVWYSLENPPERDDARTFAFGEPGFRTVYRRVLLIAPQINYGISVNGVSAGPGVVRVLNQGVERSEVSQALAALIAFQERYDLSVRLEWDPGLPPGGPNEDADLGRWVIRLNTLGDLTKRENRYEHHGFVASPQLRWQQQGYTSDNPDRFFPHAVASGGVHSSSARLNLRFVDDPEIGGPANAAEFQAVTEAVPDGSTRVVAFQPNSAESRSEILAQNRRYSIRPFVYVLDGTDTPATARAVLNEDGNVVHVTSGIAPLSGARRGEDIMLTDALAFDLRVFDPGAPIYGYYRDGNLSREPEQMLHPGDPPWVTAYERDVSSGGVGFDLPTNQSPAMNANFPFLFQRQGAYVDLGYGITPVDASDPGLLPEQFLRRELVDWSPAAGADLVTPDFGADGLIRVPTGLGLLTTRFAAYDTWSWHYENNGVNEDGDDNAGDRIALPLAPNRAPLIDEAVNGFDDPSTYDGSLAMEFGPDDSGERETRPPYGAPLRGVQATLRVYERDSRQVRQTSVRESFVPE